MIHGFETWNAEFIDAQYRIWKETPDALPRDWQIFFQGFDLSGSGRFPEQVPDEDQLLGQIRVETLIHRYRDLGHLLSCLDPLVACPTDHPLLTLSAFEFTTADMDRSFFTNLFPGQRQARLKEILSALKETYCRSIGVEYMHLQDPAERKWLQGRMEPERNRPKLTAAEKRRILEKLHHSTLFETFLNKKYPGQTRFSLEGADVLIPTLDYLLTCAGESGCREVILGMPHRGRLNVQANMLHKSFEDIFCEFEGTYDPGDIVGAGDVKYHKGYIADIQTPGGKTIRVALINNPSHLEAVDPVVEGLVRARQEMLHDEDYRRVMPLLLHGDAAFAGQGVVAEVFNMSQLEGYRTGGTIHIVVNNQIGYTTLPEDARSTRYSTDIAKMLMVPIFHVHGENPEAAAHVIKLACDYRVAFKKDVVVDITCFRRYGHNEGDEPYFTQPEMYGRIKTRPPLSQLYADQLVHEGVLDQNASDKITAGIAQCLELGHQSAQKASCPLPPIRFYENWEGYHGRFSFEPVKTAIPLKKLISLAEKLNTTPPGFVMHPKIQRLRENRAKAIQIKGGIDWAFGEALAFASLLAEGAPVRLSGQDCRRGTFSQRHAVLTDMVSEAHHTPLNQLMEGQARFSCFNSLLSESGVLGFEYGYSLVRPEGLTLWEAQFGDFANGAQGIIDLFIASGESKWQRLTNLVLLLPHGYEGMGPEHSSGRLERFLQLCAEDNLQVCNLTTPAQYFHLLRRQVKAGFRKPLVIMTPKSLMRHPEVLSPFSDLTSGGFQAVLNDPKRPKKVKQVLFCSGKIYYELLARRFELKQNQTAILRVEQFHPFPSRQVKEIVSGFPKPVLWNWVQEEPENMGAWQFMRPRLEEITGERIVYIGRKASASPATGISRIYRQDQAAIIDQAMGKKPIES
ncbi:MAG: 2-oxoglutarate dehydrogenase E1 component [Pseudomonadota bacterium]